MVYRSGTLREVGTPCPRCAAVLRDKKIAGLRVRECSGCWGVWLDTGDYRAAGQNEAVQAALAGVVAGAVRRDVEERLRCPFCDRLMRRRLFRKHSGVTIDECQRHGVWFDVDELRQGFAFALAQTQAKAAKAARSTRKPARRPAGAPVKIETGGPSGEATLRQAVRLLWKALFGGLVKEPKALRGIRKRK